MTDEQCPVWRHHTDADYENLKAENDRMLFLCKEYAKQLDELKAKLERTEKMVREDEKSILIHINGMKELITQRDKACAEVERLKANVVRLKVWFYGRLEQMERDMLGWRSEFYSLQATSEQMEQKLRAELERLRKRPVKED